MISALLDAGPMKSLIETKSPPGETNKIRANKIQLSLLNGT